ncbi:MAG: hypothetical protein LUI10_01735 [Lachnospiraceae bacterium]|nr:hypothetical protein [Lachnospiraceae bacterium]
MENIGQTENVNNVVEEKAAASSAEKQKSGESYNISDQELIRLLVKSRQAQDRKLEYEDLDGYEMPPRTQFSMLKKPAVSIKRGKLTFNMACIRLFEGVEFILPLIHVGKKKLTIVMCAEEENASVAWARKRQKDGQWTNRDITSPDFVYNIYRMMNWKEDCRYKVLGYVANSAQGLVLVFELEEAIMFSSVPEEYVDKETGETKKRQVKYYPDFYKNRIGKSYNDYMETRQINMFEYLEEYRGKTYADLIADEKAAAKMASVENYGEKRETASAVMDNGMISNADTREEIHRELQMEPETKNKETGVWK